MSYKRKTWSAGSLHCKNGSLGTLSSFFSFFWITSRWELRKKISYLFQSIIQVALRIISVLGERLRDTQGRLRDLAGERVEQRLAGTLLMLSSKLGTTLPFTRQEIADMAGTTTETAIRVMSRMKERGIIRSIRGKTIIIDGTKLRLLSEGPPRV